MSSSRLIDAPAEETLGTLSIEDLIGEVRRVVAGPRTWSPSSTTQPTLLRQSIVSKDSTSLSARDPELLQGGTHILFYVSGSHYNRSGFEIWEVHTGRQLFKWGHQDYCVWHVVSEFPAGKSKIVVLVTFSIGLQQTSDTLILELDLTTGDSDTLSHLILNSYRFPVPHLVGDFFSCEILYPMIFLLVNWRTTECIIFDSERIVSYVLFPGHFILAYRSDSSPLTLNLHLYSISSFDNLWCPVSSLAPATHTNIWGIPFLSFSAGGANLTGPEHIIRDGEPGAPRNVWLCDRGRKSRLPSSGPRAHKTCARIERVRVASIHSAVVRGVRCFQVPNQPINRASQHSNSVSGSTIVLSTLVFVRGTLFRHWMIKNQKESEPTLA
ncbi:hypothetical protein B0H19DRAFT_1258113 [Mycena capillaripes]|nr:hypothetical protein B0H19DRAFT_1258113 [Mycena capillaripes]